MILEITIPSSSGCSCCGATAQASASSCCPRGEPDWPVLQEVFRRLFKLKQKVFPGQFRTCTLRGHRGSRDKREVLTLQLLYQALPAREIKAFASAACPCSFGAMYDKLKERLSSSASGVFGDYGIKLALDMVVMLGGVPPEALSRWPTDCPGYTEKLKSFFPGLPAADHLRALYWIHRELGKSWRFAFPESCAQLCWDHRRETGALDDTINME